MDQQIKVLQDWIQMESKKGFSAERLLESMVSAGYQRPFSEQLIASTLADNPKDAPDFSQALSIHSPTVLYSVLYPPTEKRQVIPEPPVKAQQTVIHAADKQVRVLTSMNLPRVVVFEGVLSADECDQLIELARPKLSKSLTVDKDTGDSVEHKARVSEGMFFQRGEHPLVQRVEQRLAALVQWPVDHGEGLQVLHYSPGGQYEPHNDYFDPAESGSAVHVKRGGQRVATLILYLNTPLAGGSTSFPDVGLTVGAVKGNALFFSYPTPTANTLTRHGGDPVLAGEKWIATKWFRQDTFI